MVQRVDINKQTKTDNAGISDHSIDTVQIDSVMEQKETIYTNERVTQDWGYFTQIAKLKSAILMKAVWTVGKGYTADGGTQVILDSIVGNGKQTFLDILFDMVVTKQAVREAYAEIVRNPDTGTLINLKILDPSSMRVIYAKNGQIKRFEQRRAAPTKGITAKVKNFLKGDSFEKFEPHEIFYLSHNQFAGSIHGISVPETMEKVILADHENFDVMQRITRFQAVPFIVFKVKSDDTTTIANFKANIKSARTDGEDLIIPDDDNILSWEVVTVNPSSVLMDWRANMNNEFYRAVGMPLILFGSAGSTESGGKIEYFGHETVFEHDQLEIENQVFQQLGLRINLNSPASLLANLGVDESKDAQNALNIQPNDTEAGVGA